MYKTGWKFKPEIIPQEIPPIELPVLNLEAEKDKKL
jgi:hypothetical protein